MGSLQTISPGALGEMWGVDIAGPLLPSSKKNVHLMVAIDYATHCVVTMPVHTVTSNHLISFLTGHHQSIWQPPIVHN